MHIPGEGVPLFDGQDNNLKINVAILTVSDRSYRRERDDLSGEEISKILSETEANVVYKEIVPDDKEKIANKLIEFSDNPEVNLIITTGGTGLAPRDVTPEATREVIEKEAPGFVEAIRLKSLEITDKAMLSRAISGIRNQTLIINFPGSPKAVKENLDIILPALPHAIETLLGEVSECGKHE